MVVSKLYTNEILLNIKDVDTGLYPKTPLTGFK